MRILKKEMSQVKNVLTIIPKSEQIIYLSNYIADNDIDICSYSDFVKLLCNLREKNIIFPNTMKKPRQIYSLVCTNSDSEDCFTKILMDNAKL